MGYLSFKGGVHPPEKKELTESKEIKKAPLPDKVYIYAANHLGAPAKIIVEPGDQVKTGQKIAEANGFISANVHSSVTGQVESIEKMVNAGSGKKEDVIVIKRTAEDEWELIPHRENYKELKKEELINIIKEAGIVGQGGAMFPTHVKFMIPEGKKVEHVIINAAECEPYITIDDRIMKEKTREIFKGLEIIQYISGAPKIYIGIESNKPEAISIMSEMAKNKANIEVKVVRTKYPQGAEKQLIKAITNKEVPSGGLPIDIGTLVLNVSTVYAIYNAIINGKPLVERGASFTGEGIKNPGNYWYKIGTRVDELLKIVGLREDVEIDRVLYGGPMTGIALPKIDLPTVKGNNAITAMTTEVVTKEKDYPCIRCSKCVSVCPIGLQPYFLKKLTDNREYDKAKENGLMDCIECGTCSYACPSGIDLSKSFKTAKKVIRAMSKRRG